jgi:hypothetical protein
MSGKRDPWIKFYFADWRAEPRLKLCSRQARSLWLDMLGVMHEAQPYGFLLVEGIAPTPHQLANLVGDPERHVKQWLGELQQAGVYSVVGGPMPDDVRELIQEGIAEGTMLSRRMVRDAAKKERDRVNGKGGGNPRLVGSGITGGVNPQDAVRDKPRERGRLRPRSQKPETRNSPNPPSAAVNPPPQHPDWEQRKAQAINVFGERFCAFWLFPCAIVPVSDAQVALEAPTKSICSRVGNESQRLHEFFGKSVSFHVSHAAKTLKENRQ